MKLLERFIKYVKYDTTSIDDAETVPSSDKQFILARFIVEELKQLGLSDIVLTDNCYVYAKLPSNCQSKTKLGFVAHLDTSNAVSGSDVRPIVHDYKGGDIVLDKNTTIKASENAKLSNYINQQVVTASGDTLLGCDDKAGIAIILTMLENLINNPTIKHGQISVAFTPDEEVGRGADFFDVKLMDADFAYTIDGEEIGEIEYENFNAATAVVKVAGKSFHPGYSKGKMINACLVLTKYISLLPENETPSTTEGYQGFYHVNNFVGSVEQTNAVVIIRDHDKDKFNKRKLKVVEIANALNKELGGEYVSVKVTDSYFNMKEQLADHMHLIDNAKLAMEQCNVKPLIKPIRGGTDGARLSYMGLPCPNLSTGGHNFHGKEEYVSVASMEKMVEVVTNIIKIYAK